MKGHTHIAGGLLFAFLFNVLGYAIPMAVIGSTFPDIDLSFTYYIPPKGVKTTLFNTHRGITHHPAIVVLLFLLWVFLMNKYPQYKFYWDFLYGFWVGYLSHLVLDAMTKKGIPVGLGYYPRFSFRLMKTGGTGEKFVFGLIVVLLIGVIFLKANPRLVENVFSSFKGLIKVS
jgi:inner membrane protein